MRLPNQFLIWPLAILCLSGALANQDSSKYEVILYWRLRQFMIDSLGGEGNIVNIVAPDCPIPCDFKAFMQTLIVPRKVGKLKNPDGTNVKVNGKVQWQYYPDYDKDFTVFTDTLFSNPEAAARELDNIHFTGHFRDSSQFAGAKHFEDIIVNVANVIEDCQKARVKSGRDPKGGWFKEIKDLIPIVANGRRFNRANHLTAEFRDWLDRNPILQPVDVRMSDPIHRAPNFVYQKVDFDRTFRENQNVAGIQMFRNEFKDFVEILNGDGSGLGHVKCIRWLEALEESLEDGCD